MSAFDGVTVKRFDPDGTVASQLKPTFVYAPKSRVLSQIVQKGTTFKLPAVAVYMMGLNRNAKRQHNKNSMHASMVDPHASHYQMVYQPVPIDLTLGMSFITRYQADMDQLISNFVPYVDPYITISWQHPVTQEELTCKTTWNGSITFDYPLEQDSTNKAQIVADTSFAMQGWMFKSNNPTVGIITKINTTYVPVADFPCLYDDLYQMSLGPDVDRFTIFGRPLVRGCDTSCIQGTSATTITMYGQMFKDVTGVFLSADGNVTAPGLSASHWSLWDVTSADAMQISAVSAFDAIELTQFALAHQDPDLWGSIKYLQWPNETSTMTVDGGPKNALSVPWNKLTVTLPPLSGQGYIDIIITNLAGGGLLSRDSETVQVNPYPTDHPNYSSWVPVVEPWAGLGISVNAT